MKSGMRNFYMLCPIQIIEFSVVKCVLKKLKVSTLPVFSSYILDIHPWVAVDSFYPQSFHLKIDI